MQKYQSKILQNAIRLPAINWNLSFFGGHYQHVNAGWHVGTEQHLAFEVIQILSGHERVNLHRKSYLLTAGDILIIPPNLAHDITCVEEMDYFNFHFDLLSKRHSAKYGPAAQPASTKSVGGPSHGLYV